MNKKQPVVLETQIESADIFNFLPDATFAIDVEGRVIAWNRAIEEMTGIKAEEMLGKGDHQYAIPFCGDRSPLLIDLIFNPQDSLQKHYRLLKKKGEVFWGEAFIPQLKPGGTHLWTKASPLYDSKGNLMGAIESIRDVTEQKQAEESLRQAEAANRRIVEALPDIIFHLSAGGVFLDYRAVDVENLAYPPDAILGKHVSEVMPPETLGPLSSAVKVARNTGEVQAVEHSMPILNGERRDFETRILITSTGDFIAVARDITERKKAEEEKAQTIEKLKQADRLKDEFLSVISHELRSPLTIITGYNDILIRNSKEPAQKDHLEKIRQATLRLQYQVDELFDFVKLANRTLRFNFEMNDLRETAIKIVESLELQAQKRQMTFELSLPEKAVFARVDRNRIKQVITNLLENALKFSPKGGRILLSLKETEGMARFEVEDEGPGIPLSEQTKIFSRFHQVKGGTPKQCDGAGLGLAIAEAIVSAHGGSLGVKSEEGKGSRFWFNLPAPDQFANNGIEERTST